VTTDVAVGTAPTGRGRAADYSPDLAIAGRTFKRLWRSAVIWSVVFGATVASSALTYVNTFPDQASRQQIAATTGQDAGVSILLGPISSIDTVGGYTVYKAYVTLTTIGAIWGLLAATRQLRGEEDSGRWQLALAGGTRPSRATVATLIGIGGAVSVVFAGTTLFTILAGRNPDVGFSVEDSIIYGLSIAIAPAVFVGVGTLTSQLGRTRRVATGLGMAVFGVCFVVRMIADSSHATKWMLWLTPFGWTERMRPFTENDLRPFVFAVAAVAALVVVATALASRRDVGEGVFADREVATARTLGLGSPFELTLRLELPVLIAWFAGVAAAGACFGIIAKVATGSVPDSMTDLLDKFGVQGTFLRQYLGVAFLMMAAIVALLPANQIGAAAEEETSGQLVNVLAQPAQRTRLFSGRLAISAAAVVIAGVIAGLFTWFGSRVQGVDPGFSTTLRAGLNVVPTALLVLGIGAVVRALRPRAAAASMYAVVAWSFIADLLASLVDSTSWLEHLSVFHYMALAPAASIDASTVALTLLLAGVLLASSVVVFAHRDIETG
jgi:ABC-2 type transport system permease protein